MKIVPDNAQHVGARNEQQDAFGFSDLARDSLTRRIGALGVVADGMGGMEEGREMSRLACRAMIETYTERASAEPAPRALSQALHTANAQVVNRARQLGLLGETGTTLAAAVIHQHALHWASVGDSRIYLFRDEKLTQLTTDHGYGRHLDRQVGAGELSARAAAEHPERHAVTSFLGLEALEEIDRTVKPFPLQPGDRVLLCTDGLHGSLTEAEISAILLHHRAAAQALVDAAVAKRRTDQDNVTAALLDYLPNRTVPAEPERKLTARASLFRRGASRVRLSHPLGAALLLLVLLAGTAVVAAANPGGGAELRVRTAAALVRAWQWLPLGRPRSGTAGQPAAAAQAEAPDRSEPNHFRRAGGSDVDSLSESAEP